HEVPALLDLVLAAATRESSASVFPVSDERLLTSDDMPATIALLCRENGSAEPRDAVDVAAAIIESLARAYADSVRLVAQVTGARLTSIRIVGGGSQNAALCARTATLAGLPVVAGPAEASALGNI